MFELKPAKREAVWIAKRMDKYHYSYFCGNCGQKSRFKKSPYCPMCGFRMIEGE